MDDLISRHGVSAWLYNLGYMKLADIVMNEQRFPSEQTKQKTLSIEEVAYELGCNNLESAYYWANFLRKLYELDFRVVRKNEA